MEKLKRLIEILSNISNTDSLDNRKYKNIKFMINKLFNPSQIPILRLEGFCGLNNPSNVCYLNSALQLLFRIDSFISLFNYIKTPSDAKVLKNNFYKNIYVADNDRLDQLKVEYEGLKLNIIEDVDIDNSYIKMKKINQDIETIQSKLNTIFDNRCRNDDFSESKRDNYYGKKVLENLIKIYNSYKSKLRPSNNSLFLDTKIYQNLIDVAFNINIAKDGREYNTTGNQNDTGEFISNLFRKLSCVDNELVINFIKSIQYQIHSTFECIVSSKESEPNISLDCLLQIKFESRMVIPGKLEYTFQELIDLYQIPETEILGILEFCNQFSKEDYIEKVKLSDKLDKQSRRSSEKRKILNETQKEQHDKESIAERKPDQDRINEINDKYKNIANNKKLKIIIPDELEYLILSVTRQATITEFHPYKITDNKFEIDGASFILKAVTIHSGGITGGHYVCAICDDNGIPTTLINDSRVSPASSDSTYIPQIPTKGITYLFRRTN
jgi:hypothetical protein